MVKTKTRKRTKDSFKQFLKYELIAFSLVAISLIGILKVGLVGQWTTYLFRFFLGEIAIVGLLAMIVLAGYLMYRREFPDFWQASFIGLYLLIVSITLFLHVSLFEKIATNSVIVQPSVIKNTFELFMLEIRGTSSNVGLGGGMIGAIVFAVFFILFDALGTKIIAFMLLIIGFILLTNISIGTIIASSMSSVFSFLTKQYEQMVEEFTSDRQRKKGKDSPDEDPPTRSKKRKKDKNTTSESSELIEENPIIINSSIAKLTETSTNEDNKASNEVKINHFVESTIEDEGITKEELVKPKVEEQVVPLKFTEVENKSYELPSIDLLNEPKLIDQSGEHAIIHQNAKKLQETFESFGVKAKVTEVHLGPAVTKYEVHPDAGVKVSKIVSLHDDLALALAAKDIRIEAPIPGKSAIGIEVPNSEVAMVSLREVLEASSPSNDSKLMIGLGKDITGQSIFAELNKMPHLLVAGATGSGKSVCINGIITSILMRAKPHEVKMMMIDPKMVELNVYNGVPHLLAPVVTDAKKASVALKKVVNEMERRYELFSSTGTRNIEGYNELIHKQNSMNEEQYSLLPFIVVIVDELADLMMVASNEVEEAITRLAQMARAAGIHLIIATQRPSVDVITGVIKANIPSRIAFSVSSSVDSRTILDMGGAEKLLGRGDMLYLPMGSSKPTRIQGAYLSDEEVERIVYHVIQQQRAQYQEEMIPEETLELSDQVDDELYNDAVDLIIELQTASVSMLQRRFRIGYTRAARLIDEMEARGIVGPYEGSRPRQVLVSQKVTDQTS